MPTDQEYEAKLATARDEWRKLKNRVTAAEAELRKKANLIQWVRAALGGDPTPGPCSEGETPEAGQLKCWIDDVMVLASNKATDHVKRLQLLIDVYRLHPAALVGRTVGEAGDWVRVLTEIRTHLSESGVTDL